MRFTQNHRLKVEISLSHLIGFERSLTISELIDRIDTHSLTSDQNLLREPEKKSYNPIRLSTPIEKSNGDNPVLQSETGEPIKKEPLKVTLIGKNPVKEIRTKEASHNYISDFSFDSIVKKWDSFVDAIIPEKKFSLGPYVGNLELASLEGNKLKVFLNDEDGKKSFGLDKDYLAKKTAEIFGKKIIFQFEDHPLNSIGSNGSKNNPNSKGENVIDDPLVDLIIKELGGEEITG